MFLILTQKKKIRDSGLKFNPSGVRCMVIPDSYKLSMKYLNQARFFATIS